MVVVGWDHGCRLAAERKVSYRTETGEEEQASVDTSMAVRGTRERGNQI